MHKFLLNVWGGLAQMKSRTHRAIEFIVFTAWSLVEHFTQMTQEFTCESPYPCEQVTGVRFGSAPAWSTVQRYNPEVYFEASVASRSTSSVAERDHCDPRGLASSTL